MEESCVELKCEFCIITYDKEEYYCCKIVKQEIPVDKELKFKAQKEIKGVSYVDCKITKVPQNLTEVFLNLQILDITKSGLKSLTRHDLAEYKFLKKFQSVNNPIEFLPGDLFEGFMNLEAVSFRENKLKIIEPSILDGLDSLKHVNFKRNVNFDICYSTVFPEYSNVTLEKMKEQFIEKIPENMNSLLKELRDKVIMLDNKMAKLKKTHTIELQKEQIIHSEKVTNLRKSHMGQVKKLKADISVKEKFIRQIKMEHERKVQEFEKKLSKEESKNKESINSLKLDNEKLEIQLQKFYDSDVKVFIQNDESFLDFSIKIEDCEFKVHKLLLAARSPTLAEMLRENPEAKSLTLVDISIGIFEKILKFFYTDQLPCNDNDDEMKLLHFFAASGRMRIKELMDHSAKLILPNVGPKNALELLKLGKKYGHDELKKKSFQVVKGKYPDIKLKDEWLEDDEKLTKCIDILTRKEDLERNIREEFSQMMKI